MQHGWNHLVLPAFYWGQANRDADRTGGLEHVDVLGVNGQRPKSLQKPRANHWARSSLAGDSIADGQLLLPMEGRRRHLAPDSSPLQCLSFLNFILGGGEGQRWIGTPLLVRQ
jgi:hypothetical protein